MLFLVYLILVCVFGIIILLFSFSYSNMDSANCSQTKLATHNEMIVITLCYGDIYRNKSQREWSALLN